MGPAPIVLAATGVVGGILLQKNDDHQ